MDQRTKQRPAPTEQGVASGSSPKISVRPLEPMRPVEKATGGSGAAAQALTVDARDVSLTFHTRDGEVEALSNVSLQISDGDFVSFIGPSGCGKTTLLRIIADLQRPTLRDHSDQRRDAGAGAVGPPLRLYFSGAGALSLADDRAQRRLAAGNHGLRRPGAPQARRTISQAGEPFRLRTQISVAAFRRHAAAGVDRPRAVVRSRSCC